MKTLYFLLLILLSVKGAYLTSNLTASPRIFGRDYSTASQARYHVKVMTQDTKQCKWKFLCSGALVLPQRAVTAATCVMPEDSNHIIAASCLRVFGLTFDQRTGHNSHSNVTNLIPHPQYSRNEKTRLVKWNFVILDLHRPLDGAQTIPLKKWRVEDKKKCIVVGWGGLDIKNKMPEDDLTDSSVTVVQNQACTDRFYKNKSVAIDSTNMCAGDFVEDGRSVCLCDLGSPLVCDDKLSGIASFNFKCSGRPWPTVYADVHRVRLWLDPSLATGVKNLPSLFHIIITIQILLLVSSY